jgi:amino acid adenylation domain-containing protein/non-ribosomal peptide synthase protein (TIGR01720 family)
MSQNLHDLQQRIAALPPEKRALFEQQLRRLQAEPAVQTIAEIPAMPPDCLPVCSWAQQRLWVLHQLEPDSAAYNITMIWRFQGSLDSTLLTRSLNAIVQRHDSLRTCFITDSTTEQAAIQTVIQSDLTLAIPIVDLQTIPNSASLVERLARQEARIPFDLTRAPLLRATLLYLSPCETVLLLTLHHIIADGWSRGILLREFAAFYKAFQAGKSATLPDLPIQYSDFAHWQQSQDFSFSLTYWRQQLANLTPLDLAIEADNSYPVGSSSATQSLCLSNEILEALKAISRQAGVTLFMTLLTAFKLLLHRYTEQDDIAIGVPIAGRSRRETESLIGFFVNTLVMRTDISGNPNFLMLLERVRQVASAAYKHQDLPFAKLVEDLQPERHLSHTPFFQVMFQFQNEIYQLQNSLSPNLAIPGLHLSQDWVDGGMTKFDLSWHVVERATGLLLVVEHRIARFSTVAIERMLEHFQVLLNAIIQNPTHRISELPLLTDLEHQHLIDWNNTTRNISETPVHIQFSTQAEYTPEHIAVIDQNEKLTYEELNNRANQLAHYLQSLGIQSDTRIGISLDHSVHLMVGLLSILKSGAAYVPIDPSLPIDRVAFMLQDAQVKLLITDRLFSSDQALPIKLPCLNIKTDWTQIATYPTHNPISHIVADDLAYLIYTSGSTGQPKGTLLSHRGLSNYLHWCLQSYITPDAIGAPVQSSISFDATVTSLYAPLLVGQAVIFLPDLIESLAHQLTQQRYSFVKLTPAHLRLLSQWYSLTSHSPILPQTFILGGEALSEADLTFWYTHAPGSRFINEYGPTEATVGCCVYEISSNVSPVISTASIPIGCPIPNTQLYILDHYLQSVPVGVPGEIYIGGVGLAQGYLNRPDLTAERFLPNPAKKGSGARLYRTGDRGCYRTDGTIEYLGRLDQQVKLRGYRIELEEIAAALKQYPTIQDAVVTAVTDPNQNLRLVAYLVAVGRIPATAQLRQFLKQTLPDYMLPAIFVPLDALPLTVNGKVDRSTLPQPDWANTAETQPQTVIEAKLAQIWSEVLGVSVNVHDNFFELGGDSILSLQIVARANQVGLKLSPRQVFQHQTIAELAAVAENSVSAEQGIVMGAVPLTPIQHWFFEQATEPHHFNQAILLEVNSGLDSNLLNQTIKALGRHHDALRLRFVQDTNGWRQFHASAEELPAFSVIDLAQLDAATQTEAIEAAVNQLQVSLDLATVLWRSVLFRLGATTDRLLLLSHHLIIDGVSWQILLTDLVTGYQQKQQGCPIQLPPKTTAFRDWAEQLVDYASSNSMLNQLEHWSTHSSLLPTDYSDYNLNTVANSNQILVTFDSDSTQSLLNKFAQKHRVQSDEILIAAISTALQQVMSLDTILIDLESHGREIPLQQVDISRTVGWFTAIFPVLLDVSSCRSEIDYLKQAKEQIRSIPNSGIDYGVLRYLKQINALPQAQIKFNYLGAIDRIAQSFILGFAQETVGSSVNLSEQRRYLIEINSWISQQQLHLSWTYSHNIYHRATIDQLAQRSLITLQSFLQHDTAPTYAATDFPAARLSQKQLDQFVTKFQKSQLGR